MKKIILILILIINLIGVGTSFAEEKTVLTTNVLGLAIGSINASLEMALEKNASLGIGGYFAGYESGDWKWSIFGGSVSYYIYPQKNSPRGFYVGPSLGVSMVNAEHTYTTYDWSTRRYVSTTETATSTFFTVSGDLGYKWIWSGFTLDLGSGVGYTAGALQIGGETLPYGGFGLTRLAVNIGYAF